MSGLWLDIRKTSEHEGQTFGEMSEVQWQASTFDQRRSELYFQSAES